MSTKPNHHFTRRDHHFTRRAASVVSIIAAISLMCAVFAPVGAATKASAVTIKSGNIHATVTMPVATASAGQRLPLSINFAIAPGWHIYGSPLPSDFQPTTVKFDHTLVAAQSLRFPKPTPVNFKVLGQTLPVYQGDFSVPGAVVLKPNITAGAHQLTGKLSFQECNDMLCKMPRTVSFALPITVTASQR